MYKLVRIEKELRLVKDDARTSGGRSEPGLPPPPAPGKSWTRCSPNEKKAWLEFVRTGRAPTGSVQPDILESWRRCIRAEVEYAGGRCWDILSPGQLEKRQDLLVEVAGPVMETLHHCLHGFGFVVVLVDPEGYILKSIGQVESLRQAEKINFGPGANWSEVSVGTNAIGTALAIGRPIQVTGAEHFNDGHHLWTCAATPIVGTDGRILGCLDISGPRENAGFHLPEMAAAAVRFIEDRLELDHAHSCLLRANQYMSAAFNSVSDGLISVDAAGLINGVNLAAARLLGRIPSELIGRPVDAAVPFKRPIGSLDGPRSEAVELDSNDGRFSCLVTTQVIDESEGGGNGALITLSKLIPAAKARPIPIESRTALFDFEDIIGRSRSIRDLLEKARLVAAGESTLLIQGESGSGKEILARAVHQAGPRRNRSFVSVNCGAMPRDLIQSELFGYSEGAFTGARKGGRRGRIEQADGGTLFLDEIAEMPLEQQVNLLRFLEDRVVEPLGDEKKLTANVRIIAATNKDLYQEVQAGRFRQDLFYRIGVVVLDLPPLREREDDVGLLAEHFLERLSVRLGKPFRRVSADFRRRLELHDWPGNIRELKNVLEQALNFMTGDELTPEHLPAYLKGKGETPPPAEPGKIIPLKTMEKNAIEKALRHFNLNVSQTARSLGIGRNTLYDKIRKYKISLSPEK